MRSRSFSIVTAAGLLALVLAVGPALAQDRAQLRADIPFEFMAGKTTMPAGEYTVQSLANPYTVAVGNSDHSARALLLTIPRNSGAAADESKLVFHKYGDRYFLAQIWTAGISRGHELPVTKAERELTRTASAFQALTIVARR